MNLEVHWIIFKESYKNQESAMWALTEGEKRDGKKKKNRKREDILRKDGANQLSLEEYLE